jgi:leader peptidase (prepilin peptidase)/N-methyltransferase
MQFLVILFGLLIGSFLTVCVYRIPLGRNSGLEEEESPEQKASANSDFFEERVTIAFPPRSFCPHCGAKLNWYRNIPLFGWLSLGGKSECCKQAIPIRYPIIELLSAVFAYLCFSLFGLNATGIIIYAFCAALIVLSFIDLEYYLLPNVITYPFIFIGVGVAVINEYFQLFEAPIVSGVKEAGLGILAGAGVLLFVSEVYLRLRKREGLGLGDVKLLAMVGVLFGPLASIYTIFVGSIVGTIIGGSLLLFGGKGISQHIPFGPYLALATLLYIFTGPSLLQEISYIIRLIVVG